jgi:hypothetical protein
MTDMTTTVAPKNGLGALLTPQDSVLILIDHQPFQFANLFAWELQLLGQKTGVGA